MLIEYLISFFVSYLIGSVPTAYIVVKKSSNVDIRTVGSGNVGGRNALDVTGKKSIGVLVVVLDILKGVLSVTTAYLLFKNNFDVISFAMIGSVLGHCYPIWLQFKGGRGLATAAGVFLVTSWILVAVWLVLYFVSSKIIKNIHLSSVIALSATPIIAFVIPEQWIRYLITGLFSDQTFFNAGTAVIGICLTKHIQPLKEMYAKKNI